MAVQLVGFGAWHDREIVPGKAWDKEIDEHLRGAELVLLLVSNDFVASDYIWSTELDIAMQRHGRGEVRVDCFCHFWSNWNLAYSFVVDGDDLAIEDCRTQFEFSDCCHYSWKLDSEG